MKLKTILLIAMLVCGTIHSMAQHTYFYQWTKFYDKDGVQREVDASSKHAWNYFTFTDDYSILYMSDKYGNADKVSGVACKYTGATNDYFIYEGPTFKYHVAKDLSVINSITYMFGNISVHIRTTESEREKYTPKLLR